MKDWKHILIVLLGNIVLSLTVAYGLVTARSFLQPSVYFSQPNFLPLLLVTGVFLFVYNNAVQLSMYFWYRWGMRDRPYYIQKLFPRLLIFSFAVVLLLFIQFALGLREVSLEASGYLCVEFPLFLLYFTGYYLLAIYLPMSNPWRRILKIEKARRSGVATITLYRKQETLLLPVTDIAVFIFIRKKCVCICKEGRQLYALKLNSVNFLSMAGANGFIQIRRGYLYKKS